jgi:hypothetical protein
MVPTKSRPPITGFFSYGFLLKNQQKSEINIICKKIKTSAAAVTPEKLQQTWHQNEYCPDIYRATTVDEHIQLIPHLYLPSHKNYKVSNQGPPTSMTVYNKCTAVSKTRPGYQVP